MDKRARVISIGVAVIIKNLSSGTYMTNQYNRKNKDVSSFISAKNGQFVMGWLQAQLVQVKRWLCKSWQRAFLIWAVPVFMADVKGDLSGSVAARWRNPKIEAACVSNLALSEFSYAKCPVTFWDVFGVKGHPVRTTIAEMGPLLLARLLNLNEVQLACWIPYSRFADG